jgi:GMP synthase-like glutamine amidotransferase/ubiquinone/menaquinone biosynthesis C-methylase UbiE
MRVCALLHSPQDTTGAIECWCVKHHHSLQEIHLYRHDILPQMNSFDFLLIMDGSQNPVLLETYPYLVEEVQFIKEAIVHHRWVVGFGLGAHLVGLAMGAQIVTFSQFEFGISSIALTPESSQNNIFNDFPATLPAFVWQSNSLSLSPGNAVIAVNSAKQPAIINFAPRCYAFLCHWELLPACYHNRFIKAVNPINISDEEFTKMHPLLYQFLDRFSKVEYYDRYDGLGKVYDQGRPEIPQQVYHFLQQQFTLQPSQIIADIGSGTGLLSKLFLRQGHKVYAIEPNADMRLIAEQKYANNPHFISLAATAEQTTLPDKFIDLIAVSTAFHWFDAGLCKTEFERILKAHGEITLLWNFLADVGTEATSQLQRILGQYSAEHRVNVTTLFNEQPLIDFFAPRALNKHSLHENIRFTRERLHAFVDSLSIFSQNSDTVDQELHHSLDSVFTTYQANGYIELAFNCKIYWGKS